MTLHYLACTVLTLLHAYLCQAFMDTYRFSIYLSFMQHRYDTELEESQQKAWWSLDVLPAPVQALCGHSNLHSKDTHIRLRG